MARRKRPLCPMFLVRMQPPRPPAARRFFLPSCRQRRAAAATEAARIAEERRLAQQRTRFDLSVEGQVAAVATSGLAEVDLPAKRDVLAHMLNAAWLPHQEYSPMFNVRML